jgi:polysaccharide export outer membrane protein
MYKKLWVILLPFFLVSCYNSKQLAYFQDLSDTSKKYTVDLYPAEPLRLQPDDQVQVNISSVSSEASQFFNLLQAAPSSGIGTALSIPNVYSLNQQGFISLPILGDIRAQGLTTEELRLRIRELLKDYLKEAVVSVKLVNFRVTVIGDVSGPKVVPVQGERINVLEALGAAGDMTVYGKRYKVKVMRQKEGNLEVAHLNFNHSRAIQSPYFQLRQNDVVYVEPNKNKGIATETWLILLPLMSTLLWAIQFLVQIL